MIPLPIRSSRNLSSKKRGNPGHTAPSLKKRNVKGLSKGSSSGKFRGTEGPPVNNPASTTTRFLRLVITPSTLQSSKLKTIFVNTETSPIDTDKEGEKETDQPLLTQVKRTPRTKLSPSQSQPHNLLDSALVLSESMSPDLNLSKILLKAKQVYSSRGKVAPSNHETKGPPEAIVELGVPEDLSLAPLPLATVVAKVLGFLDLPVEVLVADDACKSEFINAITSLQSQLPSAETTLGQLLEDFISKVYSADISSLESRKQDLDSMGKELERTMMLRIKALEDELLEARTGLANIRATNNDFSEKLKHFEQARDSNVSAALVEESELREAREA
ncbi:hypothetical protein PIB30_073936 [Stylosanthes scabra]|uniref:Uncharacterized protein n=1 Tax=Stylosanthes scabra TaxID=79078 RepID=A0ABU6SR26_9FABA|nr:hypothetical protein [Stylosanthes scabra]